MNNPRRTNSTRLPNPETENFAGVADVNTDIPETLKTLQGYMDAIQTMFDRGRFWLAGHPGLNGRVQWKYPKEVFLACGFETAVRLKLVVLDEGAAQLCGFMNGESKEASVAMMRIALERLNEPNALCS